MARNRLGFTLVEVLVVVILLGILAAVVVPNYMNAATDARAANVKENLLRVRAGIQIYRNEHTQFPAGTSFQDQMLGYTDAAGNVVAVRDAAHPFGRYLDQMPTNIFTNSKALRVETSPSAAFSPPVDRCGLVVQRGHG
jgi:general secretion pathway protein G